MSALFRLNAILSELKRRRVYRASAIYAAAAFGVVQVADAVFGALHLPDWAMTVLVLVVLAGFPITIILSWLFDITPDGITRSAALPEGQIRQLPWRSAVGPVFLLTVSIALLVGAGWWQLQVRGDTPAAVVPLDDRSLAVLPFESEGGEDDAQFAAGIHSEIVARLGKIADLKVISQTSVLALPQGSPADIAKALGVRFLLRGTVRREGDRVRIETEMIDAATDREVLRMPYERPWSDLFAIQADVARRIASALSARLSPREWETLETSPTVSTEATEYLLRGHAYIRSAYEEEGTSNRMNLALAMYDSATHADTAFALAWTHLAWTHLRLYWFNYDHTAERLARAKRALDRAMALDPRLPETHHVLGNYHYWGFRDYPQALFHYATAREELPNDSELAASIGFVQRRQGDFDEALRYQLLGFELDPRNAIYARNIAMTYRAVRNYDDALRFLDRAAALTGNSSATQKRAEIMIARNGDLAAARAALTAGEGLVDEEPMAHTWFWVRLYSRDFAAAASTLEQAPFEQFMEPGESTPQYQIYPKPYLRGWVHELTGNAAAARNEYQAALRALEAAGGVTSDDSRVLKALGLTYAALGRRDDAMQLAKRIEEMLPVSADVLWGPQHLEYAARIRARLGDAAGAVPILRELLGMNYYNAITPSLLRVDPVWDPIRNDPGFLGLVGR